MKRNRWFIQHDATSSAHFIISQSENIRPLVGAAFSFLACNINGIAYFFYPNQMSWNHLWFISVQTNNCRTHQEHWFPRKWFRIHPWPGSPAMEELLEVLHQGPDSAWSHEYHMANDNHGSSLIKEPVSFFQVLTVSSDEYVLHVIIVLYASTFHQTHQREYECHECVA